MQNVEYKKEALQKKERRKLTRTDLRLCRQIQEKKI